MMPAGQDSMWIVFDVFNFRKQRKKCFISEILGNHLFFLKKKIEIEVIPESLGLASICNKNRYSSLSSFFPHF